MYNLFYFEGKSWYSNGCALLYIQLTCLSFYVLYLLYCSLMYPSRLNDVSSCKPCFMPKCTLFHFFMQLILSGNLYVFIFVKGTCVSQRICSAALHRIENSSVKCEWFYKMYLFIYIFTFITLHINIVFRNMAKCDKTHTLQWIILL